MDRSNSIRSHDGIDDGSTVLSLGSSPAPSDFSASEHNELTNVSVPNSDRARKGKIKSNLNPHPKYFFEDGNLLIRVEDVDYKVHRYFFMRDSAPFRQLSKDGIVGRIVGDETYATENTEPLTLGFFSSLDFERFLDILYPNRFDQRDDTSAGYWSSVLKVSATLAFMSICALSIQSLSSVATPVEKIALGREFGIVYWLRKAYHNICKRKETLTKDEGRRLGVDEVVGIMEARQIFLWEKPKMELKEQNEVLDRIFGLEAAKKDKPKPKLSDLPGGIGGSGGMKNTQRQSGSDAGAGGSGTSEGNQGTLRPGTQTGDSSQQKGPGSEKSTTVRIPTVTSEPAKPPANSSSVQKSPPARPNLASEPTTEASGSAPRKQRPRPQLPSASAAPSASQPESRPQPPTLVSALQLLANELNESRNRVLWS